MEHLHEKNNSDFRHCGGSIIAALFLLVTVSCLVYSPEYIYRCIVNREGKRIPQTAERIEELQASISNVTRFIDKAKRYTEINELSGEILNLFIEKIEVGERAERYSRTAEQTIIIHYLTSASSEHSLKKPRK